MLVAGLTCQALSPPAEEATQISRTLTHSSRPAATRLQLADTAQPNKHATGTQTLDSLQSPALWYTFAAVLDILFNQTNMRWRQ